MERCPHHDELHDSVVVISIKLDLLIQEQTKFYAEARETFKEIPRPAELVDDVYDVKTTTSRLSWWVLGMYACGAGIIGWLCYHHTLIINHLAKLT